MKGSNLVFPDGKVSGALNSEVKFNQKYIPRRVEIKINTAPTTSENLTITRDAKKGSTYDFNYYTRDLSVGSVTTLVIVLGDDYAMDADDELTLAYANTDARTITYRWVIELLED